MVRRAPGTPSPSRAPIVSSADATVRVATAATVRFTARRCASGAVPTVTRKVRRAASESAVLASRHGPCR